MTIQAEAVLSTALRLPPADRAELIESLFGSFDQPTENQACEEAWRQESQSRLAAYRAGKIEAFDAEDVFQELGENPTRPV